MENIRKILLETYGMKDVQDITKLDGYADYNFKISVRSVGNESIRKYVMKFMIADKKEDEEFIREYVGIILHLSKENFPCSRLVKNNKNEYMNFVDFPSSRSSGGKKTILILFHYIEGEMVEKIGFDESVCLELGKLVYQLHDQLKKFDYSPAIVRPNLEWRLENVGLILKHVEVIPNECDAVLVRSVILEFQTGVLASKLYGSLEKGIIHGDIKGGNLVGTKDSGDGDGKYHYSIIDFGDSSLSACIFEIAITITLIWMNGGEVDLNLAANFIAGYRPLTDDEFNILKISMCARLAFSVTMGLYSHSLHPENIYVLTTQKSGWKFLKDLHRRNNETFVAELKGRMRRIREITL